MADGRKQYVIEINGIQQSIDAVESLNKQLDALEKRIDSLSKRNINISASGGGNTKALDEEAKMLQQIDQLHQKVVASQKAEYQELLHAKEELKEFQAVAKSLAAQDNLKSGINDTSTMMGMKAQLKDIKTAMQTLDVESDKFRQLQKEANELNNKLKEIEQGYGQFGRNVGNYAEGAYEGMKKFSIEIGGVTKEFESAKKALKELKAEMQTLQYKQDKGIITEEETERFKSLVPVVRQLESAIQDAGKPLDNMLDTMQSLVAIASVGQGLSALFGIDDSEIEKTIQKLVALQNVLQGLQTIQNQITSKQGIGLFLSKGSGAIDSLTKSIFGVTAASKNATIAVKLFSGALKGIGFGLVIAGISTLIDIVGKWITKQQEAKKKAEELRKEENKLNATLQVQRVQLQNTLSTLEKFNGSKKEEERIVKDLNSKYGQALGTYKTIAQWKDALKKKTDAYIESLKLEAEMQAAIKKLEDAYIKQQEAQNYKPTLLERLFEGGAAARARVKAMADQAVKEAEDVVSNVVKKINDNNQKNKINIYSPQVEKEKKIKDDSKKIEEAVRQAQNNINDLRLKLMREGLRKELAQLDENNRREFEKIRKNGQKVEEQLLLQEKYYQEQRKRILQEYSKETLGIADENTTRDIQTQIDKINNSLDELGRKMNVTFNEPRSSLDNLTKKLKEAGMTVDDFMFVNKTEPLRKTSFNEGKFDEYMQQLTQDDKIQKYLIEKWGDDVAEYTTDVIEDAYNKVYSRVIELRREYGDMTEIFSFDENGKPSDIRSTLMTSLQIRTEITRGEFKKMLKLEQDFYREREKLQKEALNREEQGLIDSTEKEIGETRRMLMELKGNQSQKWSVLSSGELSDDPEIGDLMSYFSKIRDENRDTYTDMEKEAISYVNRLNALYDQLTSISSQYAERIKKIETDTLKDIAASENKLFDQRFRDYDEYMQKMQKDMSNLPTTNKWGFTDLKGLKSVITEITDATDIMRQYVQTDIDQVNDDFRNGLITEEDKNRILANLSGVLNGISEIDKQTNEKLKEGHERRKREINDMIQIIGQAATQIIQSIGDINQAAFEKQMEAIERQTDELEKQLDKQRELTEKYKDDVDSIEDELATARGDRRQQLIDQLNAQMAAQRESLAQEKRMEKEREKLDKKKKQLEYENEMRKWRQSILTAAVNTALAISSAAVNSWPVPAIPMMAAAGAAGAVQMAAVLANKPRKYAEGGLLQGRSHAQGGIPVGNTGIEVEGKEYIINKRTTMQNVDVLDFVNSKKRKLTIDDFIDFYTKGSKVSRNVSSMRAKFEDGGQLPTIRTDIELNSRLIDTMERYSERAIQVEVVDIINKADDVRRVQTLAGLS